MVKSRFVLQLQEWRKALLVQAEGSHTTEQGVWQQDVVLTDMLHTRDLHANVSWCKHTSPESFEYDQQWN